MTGVAGRGKRVSLGVVGVLSILLVWLLPGSHKADGADRINVGYAMVSPNGAAAYVAKEQGFFDKNGLEAQLIFISGMAQMSKALIARDVGVAVSGAASIVKANIAGADLVIIGGLVNKLNFHLMVGEKVQTVNDLRGKKIGIGNYGDVTHLAGLSVLNMYNMESTRENITFLPLGAGPQRLAGLQTGNVDGAIFSSGMSTVARAKGFKSLLNLEDIGLLYPSTSLVGSRRFVNESPTMTQNAVRAIYEAVQFIKEGRNQEKVQEVLGKYMKVKDRKRLQDLYEEAVRIHDESMDLPEKSVGEMVKILRQLDPKTPDISPSQVLDLRFVKTLRVEGKAH